jgi:outer membrane protein OmpA-like peptidoglycan-associated protein
MASLAPAEKAPAGKPLKVGSPHDPAEREADRIADLLTAPEEPAMPVCAACAAGGAPCPACGGGGCGAVLRRKGEPGGLFAAVGGANQVNRVTPTEAGMRHHRFKPLQAKLSIGQPNDVYEQEADRVAAQIMAMPDPMSTVQRQPEATEANPTPHTPEPSTENHDNVDDDIDPAMSRHLMEGAENSNREEVLDLALSQLSPSILESALLSRPLFPGLGDLHLSNGLDEGNSPRAGHARNASRLTGLPALSLGRDFEEEEYIRSGKLEKDFLKALVMSLSQADYIGSIGRPITRDFRRNRPAGYALLAVGAAPIAAALAVNPSTLKRFGPLISSLLLPTGLPWAQVQLIFDLKSENYGGVLHVDLLRLFTGQGSQTKSTPVDANSPSPLIPTNPREPRRHPSSPGEAARMNMAISPKADDLVIPKLQPAQTIEQRINGSRGYGQPLGNNVSTSMAQAFGTDFSGVRIHTDGESDQLNQALRAKAFTTGQDIYFRSGEYAPGSRDGQELLAHELTHVVQQTQSISSAHQLIQLQRPDEYPHHRDDPASPQPERTHFDVTGSYATPPGTSNRDITIQINQAGHSLIGWWQARIPRNNSGRSTASLPGSTLQECKITGSLINTVGENTIIFSFLEESSRDDVLPGKLVFTQQVPQQSLLEIKEHIGHSYHLYRYDTRSALSDSIVGQLPGPSQQHYRRPISPRQQVLIDNSVASIVDLLGQFYSENEGLPRRGKAMLIDNEIGRVFSQVSSAQHQLLKNEMRLRLAERRASSRQTQFSALDSLYDVHQQVEKSFSHFRYLGIVGRGGRPSADSVLHHYRVRTFQLGASAAAGGGAGASIGRIEVDKGRPQNPEQDVNNNNWRSLPGWPKKFSYIGGRLILGFEGGPSVQRDSWSYTRARYNYTEHNLVGPVKGMSCSVSIAPGQLPVVPALNYSTLTLLGDGRFPPLKFEVGEGRSVAAQPSSPRSGRDLLPSASCDASGGYAGIEQRMFGVPDRPPAEHNPRVTNRSRDAVTSIYSAFPTDGHYLLPTVRDSLRTFLAENRALFEPHARVNIRGYASPFWQGRRYEEEDFPGQRYNLNLSRLRARNTAKAIRDIFPYMSSIRHEGFGADEAFRQGIEITRDPQEWRRVDIVVNGIVRLRLYAE